MLLPSKRSSRSVDYLLATLSPLEVSRATRTYLEGLSESDLQALVERSLARMDDDERAYYAISPDFATFLEQNHRALRTLDHDALRAILLPVITARSANVEGTEDESLRVDELSATLRAALPPLSPREAWRRLTRPGIETFDRVADRVYDLDAALGRFYRRTGTAPFVAAAAIGASARTTWRALLPTLVRTARTVATALGIVAAGAAVALLLLDVTIPAGKAAMSWLLDHPHTQVAHVHRSVVARAPHRARAVAHHASVPVVVAQRTAPPATPKPTPAPTVRPTIRPTAHPTTRPTAPPVRIAAAKPRPRPAAHKAAPRRVASLGQIHRETIAGTLPSHDAPLVQRARLIVMSYLDSLMRGDASSALGNLGLSASAGTSNLTEAPILAGATEFKVVRATLADSGNAKVQVVIDSPQGRFFGDYIVSANGPAAWITQHEVIPVESTARHR